MNCMKCSARKHGFTLIELVITIAIAMFLMVSGSLALTETRKNQALKKAQQQLKIGLEQAKNDAFYGKKPNNTSTSCATSPYLGNMFEIKTNTPPTIPSNYTLSAVCSGLETVTSLTFDTDIRVTQEGVTQPIIFKSVTGGVFVEDSLTGNLVPIPPSSIITYKLELISSGNTKTVTVNPSGGINVSE